jgi:hypothetical protein
LLVAGQKKHQADSGQGGMGQSIAQETLPTKEREGTHDAADQPED